MSIEAILAAGRAAQASLLADHGALDDMTRIALCGRLAKSAALCGTHPDAILVNGKAAQAALQRDKGGLADHQHIRRAAGQQGEPMSKALPPAVLATVAKNTGLEELLEDLLKATPAPTLADLSTLAAQNPMVYRQNAARKTLADRQAAQARREKLRPPRPIAPYAQFSDRIGDLDVDDFARALVRDRRAGHALHTPHLVTEHAHEFWDLSREHAARLAHMLADRLRAQRDQRGA